MKVLIVTADFPKWDGGVAVLGEKLAGFMHKDGVDVAVLTPLQLDGDAEFDRQQGYRIIRTRNIKDRYLKYVYASWCVRRRMNREKFDAVLATTWFPFAPAALNFSPKVPVSVMAHGNDFLEPRWQKRFWNRRMSRVFHQASHRITCSRESQRALAGMYPAVANRIDVLFPAVDPQEFPCTPPPSGPPILLTLGRLVERKGQDMVLRALPVILKQFPDAEYWIAGRGSDRLRLEELASTLGISGRVRFLGFVPAAERIQLYQRCHMYLMPSRTIGDKGDFEGFGITYLEANACGRPVIGGRSGGVEDAVKDGETGFLVDPHSPEEIADRVLRLLNEPGLAEKLGRQGRERIDRELNWSVVAREMRRLLSVSGVSTAVG